MARVTFNTEDIIARARVGAMQGVLAATEEVRNEAIRLILDTPKTGKVYKRRSVEHQASAPGEPPASDTGTLVNRIRTEYSSDGLRGSVIASTLYAPFLEFGTQHMEPRPFMRPALANKREEIFDTISRSIGSAIGVGAGSGLSVSFSSEVAKSTFEAGNE